MDPSTPIYQLLHPSIAPFLSNNHPLDYAHLELARTKLNEEEEALQDVNDGIDRLQATIAELRNKASHLSRICEAYRHTLAPFRRCPPEIIVKIITAALPPGCILDHEGRLDFMRYRCVSRSWRQLLFSTPVFWRGLKIPYSGDAAGTPSVHTVAQWVQRGGSSTPLTLIPDFPVTYPLCLSAEDIVANLPLLNPGGVWKEVGLPMSRLSRLGSDGNYLKPTACRLYRAITDGHRCWDSLRVLHISIHIPPTYLDPFREDGSTRKFAAIFPRLEQLNLLWDNETPAAISHPTLGDLRLSLYPGSRVHCTMQIISQFPRLTHLALVNASPSIVHINTSERDARVSDLNTSVPLVRLARLRRLELTATASFILAHAHYLDTPALDTIYFTSGTTGVRTPRIEPLVAFMHRWPSLSNVIFEEEHKLTARWVAALIHSAKSLRQLYITDWAFLHVFQNEREYLEEAGDFPATLRAIYHPRFSQWEAWTKIIPFFRTKMDRLFQLSDANIPSSDLKIAIVFEDHSALIDEFAEENGTLDSLDITIGHGVCDFL